MTKLTFYTIIFWMILCIIFIIGQFVGTSMFFVVCNGIFAFVNGVALIAMIPSLIDEFKNLFVRK